MTPAEDRIAYALAVLDASASNPAKAVVLLRVVLMGGGDEDVFDLLGMYDESDLEERVQAWSA